MKAKQKTKKSFILTLTLITLVGYFTIKFIQLQIDISEQKQTAANLVEQYNSQLLANSELERRLNSGSEAEYIERVAREDLGYVMPGEKVYIDISAGD